MHFSLSKLISQKLPIQPMLMIGVVSNVVTSGYKTKSSPLANQKNSPVSLREAFPPKEFPAVKYATKMNSNNKSAS